MKADKSGTLSAYTIYSGKSLSTLPVSTVGIMPIICFYVRRGIWFALTASGHVVGVEVDSVANALLDTVISAVSRYVATVPSAVQWQLQITVSDLVQHRIA